MNMSQEISKSKNSRKLSKRISKAVMKSYRIKVPNYDLPLRFRPWFVLFTSLFVVSLALLVITGMSRLLPLNGTILRIICMCMATVMFYFIFDAEEESRRIWFWRHAALTLTSTVCFFFGGIVSEIVHALLPNKHFSIVDVAANLLGSTVGLWIAYYLERYYRHRREISRLYRPIALDNDTSPASDSDYDSDEGTMLLPTHYEPRRPRTTTNASTKGQAAAATAAGSKAGSGSKGRDSARHIRLGPGDVWDEREDDLEVFGIGSGSDGESDDDERGRQLRSAVSPVRGGDARLAGVEAKEGPRIVVSAPSSV